MTGGMERMPDAALSRKLGHYQKMAAVWRLVGLAGAVGGVIAFFAVQGTALRAVLTAALFFGGICCAVFLGGGEQKKCRALLREQLGDFFRAELEKAFGPDLRPPALGIAEPPRGRLSRRPLHRRQCAAAPCLSARSAARGL